MRHKALLDIMRSLRIIIFILGVLVLVSFGQFAAERQAYYPNVQVSVPIGLKLVFLREKRANAEACAIAASTIASAIQPSCPLCRISANCETKRDSVLEVKLSDAPIDVPSTRFPGGVVLYEGDSTVALRACMEAEQSILSLSGIASYGKCYAPRTVRSRGLLADNSVGIDSNTPFGILLIALLAWVTASFVTFLTVRYGWIHEKWSHDQIDSGPQKFHAIPTPRIGGLSLAVSLLICEMTIVLLGAYSDPQELGYLIVAAIPAFLIGITEDVTKQVSAQVRLASTMIAPFLGIWLLQAVLPHVGIPGLDFALSWTPLAVAFTIFAVSGVTNAINIIDGYNGLAAGYAIIALVALSIVCGIVGDHFLLLASALMIGALFGFLIWNYPSGSIFLGDGGAYLIGFWVAETSVLLISRHPEVSPWFPLVLVVYPVFETMFSIYRKKIVRGSSPGVPDGLHLHMLIYKRLVKMPGSSAGPLAMTRRNNLVAPYIWITSASFCTAAVAFWDRTPYLIGIATLFCCAYVWIYAQIVRWRVPGWLIYK